MLTDLQLLSGNDIPFMGGQTIVHQPTIREIGFIGEEKFFTAIELLKFSKNNLKEEDRTNLADRHDFEILIAILREPNEVMQQNKNCIKELLMLLFPMYDKISFEEKGIFLSSQEDKMNIKTINKNNYEEFRSIITQLFSFIGADKGTNDYNPQGKLAAEIADKLRERHQKLARLSGEKEKKIDVLSRYCSIMATGKPEDLNIFLNYTVYQLFDQFKRYELKMAYDIFVQSKMAGAKDVKEVDDWMSDIHL